MRFGILGPLQVLANERVVDTGSRKQQIILALLLCNANSWVSVDSLSEALWGGKPPPTGRKNIQVYVSTLRGLVSPESANRISYRSGGYVFHANPAELDSLSFEERARVRHKLAPSGQPAAVAGALATALALWRGRALEGMRDVPLVGAAVQRLERRFLTVFEDWAEAQIAAGGAAAAIERIAEVASEHPLRERLRMLQMAALREAGRRSEALAVYDELRLSLAAEFGISPGAAAIRYHQTLLREQVQARRPAPGRREPAPTLLPREPTAFTEREACTGGLVDALVSGSRLVIVTGPLGSGKTALAVHAARQLGDHCPDGRIFVRLRDESGRPRPPGEVLSQLLWTVDPGIRHEPLAGLRKAWQRWLAGHRALVILDDARQESQVRPMLAQAGDGAVVVTARPQLAGLAGARHLQVPALNMTEALRFMERVVGADRVTADRRAAERIISLTGSLPLALRLAAERLAILRHVPLREYVRRLEGSPSLLDELTAGDNAIRARLAEAIRDLPGPASEALPRLAMLPRPGFTLSEAARALGTSEDVALRVLETLLEANVITVPQEQALAPAVSYGFPLLLRGYAREMAAAAGVRKQPTRIWYGTCTGTASLTGL